ncbi:MAG: hypothetical protein ABW135_09145 [Thermoleophilaceae bacterium]
MNGTIPTDGLPGAPTLTVFSVTTDGAGAAADTAGKLEGMRRRWSAPAPPDVAGHGRFCRLGMCPVIDPYSGRLRISRARRLCLITTKSKRLLVTIAVVAGLLATAGPTAFMSEINDDVLANKSEVLMESITVHGRAMEPAKSVLTRLEFPNLTSRNLTFLGPPGTFAPPYSGQNSRGRFGASTASGGLGKVGRAPGRAARRSPRFGGGSARAVQLD